MSSLQFFHGHTEKEVEECDMVIYSSAIKPGNVAYEAAYKQGIPLVRRAEATVIELSEGMVAAGTMRANAREIAALARNVALVSTYWLSFQRLESPAAAEAQAARLDHAAYQVMALVAPFLVGEARALIDRLGGEYLEGG